MLWRGCSHPAALCCKPLHPPTGLLRWLTRFSVAEQVERPRAIWRHLAVEVARVERRARVIMARIGSLAPKHGGRIILLPELLL